MRHCPRVVIQLAIIVLLSFLFYQRLPLVLLVRQMVVLPPSQSLLYPAKSYDCDWRSGGTWVPGSNVSGMADTWVATSSCATQYVSNAPARIELLLANKTLYLAGDSLMHAFYESLLTTMEHLAVENSSWARLAVGGPGYNSEFTNGCKISLTWLTCCSPADGRYWGKWYWYNQTDLLLVNNGAWVNENHRNTSFPEGVTKFAKMINDFPGVGMWREYQAVHFPTTSGEYKNTQGFSIRDGDDDTRCVANLTSEQVGMEDYWRRKVSNLVMETTGTPILRTFDFGVGAGRQEKGRVKKGGKENLDCRHHKPGAPIWNLYLSEMADYLDSHPTWKIMNRRAAAEKSELDRW